MSRIQAAASAAQAAQLPVISRPAISAAISLCHSAIQSSASRSNASGLPLGSPPLVREASSEPAISPPCHARAAVKPPARAEDSAAAAQGKGSGAIGIFAPMGPC